MFDAPLAAVRAEALRRGDVIVSRRRRALVTDVCWSAQHVGMVRVTTVRGVRLFTPGELLHVERAA